MSIQEIIILLQYNKTIRQTSVSETVRFLFCSQKVLGGVAIVFRKKALQGLAQYTLYAAPVRNIALHCSRRQP